MWTKRRLASVGRRISAIRDEIRIAEEQSLHFTEVSDDARLRSIVSEAPLDDADHIGSARTAAAMQRHLDDLRDELSRLEVRQDELLDELSARRRP